MAKVDWQKLILRLSAAGQALCAERAGALGPAKYLLPPAANHTSDIARGTTKPSQAGALQHKWRPLS